MKFKKGDKVTLLANNDGMFDIIVGHTYFIHTINLKLRIVGLSAIAGGDRILGSWCDPEDVELVEAPVKAKVKPSNATKPRIKTFASGKRQFDVEFKMMIVRTANSYSGTRTGQVAALLKKYSLDKGYLKYWRKQFNEGHFTANRAVAFSRKPTMIHG
jgi:transposase-like protein